MSELPVDNKEQPQQKKNRVISCETLARGIPELPCSLAVMILLVNVFFPSFGSFYLICIGDKCRKSQLVVATLQLITTPLIVGYIWSIYWGIKAIKKSY